MFLGEGKGKNVYFCRQKYFLPLKWTKDLIYLE
jgi:hypothetical protein